LLGENENLTVYDAYVDESNVLDALDAFYRTVEPQDEVMLCSDLYGGSVNQYMMRYLDRPNTRLVSGVNMTFMMNLLGEEDHVSDERLDEIIAESREYLCRVQPEQLAGTSCDSEEEFF
jgi:mannose/fructose-specific phosphotransferase system component IIA